MSLLTDITLDGNPGDPQALGPVSDFAHQSPWVVIPPDRLPVPIAELVKRDTAPLPVLDDREGYCGERHFDYWLSGLDNYLYLAHTLRGLGLDTDSPSTRILEFGAATGRILRHFRFQCSPPPVLPGEVAESARPEGAFPHPPGRLWAADLNRRNIEWMRRFLPPDLCVFQNTVLPHLPLEDNSFDLIYAVSVFTHIDHFEVPWLLELRRILRPGGFLVLSIHTDHTWSIMNPHIPLYEALTRRAREVIPAGFSPRIFEKPMPSPRIVFSFPGNPLNNCNVFHSHDYIHREWGRFMEIARIDREGMHPHDAVFLRKPL